MRRHTLQICSLLAALTGCDAGIDVVAATDVKVSGDGVTARVDVTAMDQNGAPVTGALVDVGGTYLVETAGDYDGEVPWGAGFDVTIAWHGNIVRRHVVSPAAFAVTVTPDPPRVNMPAALSWPAQAGTNVCVTVGAGAAVCADDLGHAELPAADFPAAASYVLVIARTLLGSDGQVTLRVVLMRSVT